MTHEEKAREIFKYRVMTDWGNEDQSGKRREIFIGHLIQDMTEALASAEKKGALDEAKRTEEWFRRAKEEEFKAGWNEAIGAARNKVIAISAITGGGTHSFVDSLNVLDEINKLKRR